MNINFLGLQADLPNGWFDRSSVVFLMPPKADLALSKIPKATQQGSPGNISINWVALTQNTAAAHLAKLEPLMSQLGSGFQVLSREENADFAAVEVTFIQNNAQLQQITCVRNVGQRHVIITGTAYTADYAEVREKTIHCVRSLQTA